MDIIVKLAYLVASILFIIGIKMLNKPATARKGNQLSALGMLIAIVATMFQLDILTLPEVLICIVIGSAIGYYISQKVQMTEMPEMVAVFNGFGGSASLFVGLSDFWLESVEKGEIVDNITLVSILLSVTDRRYHFYRIYGSIWKAKRKSQRKCHRVSQVSISSIYCFLLWLLSPED
jgi:NAD(P) transhydrogenase subunit beta